MGIFKCSHSWGFPQRWPEFNGKRNVDVQTCSKCGARRESPVQGGFRPFKSLASGLLGPGIAQRDGAVEHRLAAWLVIDGVGHEITDALELAGETRLRRS